MAQKVVYRRVLGGFLCCIKSVAEEEDGKKRKKKPRFREWGDGGEKIGEERVEKEKKTRAA